MNLAETITAAQAYLDPRQIDCVVFHSPCNDGSGAALAAWKALGEAASYERLIYHRPFNEESLRGKKVVVVDASFKKDVLQRLRMLADRIMILDHHDSAMRDLHDEEGCFFTMHNSGAVLSWHYFHGLETPPPQLLQLIEDRDLWNWKYRNISEPLYYAIKERCSNSDFKSYAPYLEQDKLNELIAYGNTLVAENHRWCEETAKGAQRRVFIMPGTNKRFNIMCRELENDRLVSELAEYLYTRNQMDFVMLWCQVSSGQYKVSFRSNHPDINLGEIAGSLGGGGHRLAAGAAISMSPEVFLEPVNRS